MPWQLTDKVRYEIFRRLGYFVRESSEHFAEYVPWFIKGHRPDLIERYDVPLDEYPRRCKWRIATWEQQLAELERGDEPLELDRQTDYGPHIIHSIVTGQPRTVYCNVPNHGLIDNLPAGCCVEVPCLVDKNRVQPTHFRALPPQLAALMQTNVHVQAVTVEAALTGKREHVYHAAMLDPHTAAELDLEQICSLVDDLIAAHGPGPGKRPAGTGERRLEGSGSLDPARDELLGDPSVGERRKKLSGQSREYGTLIIHSMETGQPRVVYGNVANHGLIDNLPTGCCVEVPCLIDRIGVQPVRVGPLPPQLAALMQTNINVQALTVEAALTGKRDHVYQAALLDPHTAAELDPEQICALVDDLIAAHGDLLPAFG